MEVVEAPRVTSLPGVSAGITLLDATVHDPAPCPPTRLWFLPLFSASLVITSFEAFECT
jgi:hypothetical protein